MILCCSSCSSVRIQSLFGSNAGKYGPEKLRTRALFTQWLVTMLFRLLTQIDDIFQGFEALEHPWA